MASGVFNSSPRTLASGEEGRLQLDSSGNLKAVGSVAAGSADSGSPVKIGALVVTAAPSATNANGNRADLTVDAYGALRVMPGEAITATDGNANNGMAGIRMTGNWGPLLNAPLIYNGTTWDRAKKPSLVSRLLSAAATTNATVVKASAGDVFRIVGYNNNAAARFLKLYDKATAPTVGTDTPVATIRLEATSRFDLELHSLYFSAGIGYAITGAAADADTTALVAGDIVAMNVIYA